MAFAIIEVPIELEASDEANFEEIQKIYKRFWIE